MEEKKEKYIDTEFPIDEEFYIHPKTAFIHDYLGEKQYYYYTAEQMNEENNTR